MNPDKKEYTKPTTLLITSYPPKDTLHGKKVGGVASYAKNTVLSTQHQTNYIILAETLEQDPSTNTQQRENKTETYTEGNHKIYRCWHRNKLSYIFTLITKLIKHRKDTNRLMIEFEFAIFGNEWKTGFLPAVLIIARFLGYKITLVQHQVVTSLTELSPHLGLSGIKKSIYEALMWTYFKLMVILPHNIITFDQIHKEKLLKLSRSARKTTVIPHGVEEYTPKPAEPHDTFDVLIFGFIAYYKGTKLAAEHFNQYCDQHPDTDMRLIVAGGESPTQKDSPQYQEYISQFKAEVAKNDKVQHTGFVPEEEIDTVYGNSDLVLLPYRALMSSSGPLSIAIKHRKPFLLSDVIAPYTKTEDFTGSISSHGFGDNYPVLDLDKNIFEQIEELRQSDKVKPLGAVSEDLYRSRVWSSIGQMYLEVLNS
jgi:glycosyltransferase involved in cell wall biosynthesis